ncbi:Calcitonin receptor [Eumeta japonica]|uniref:Calcitonin receptor n=1 Tax=Eumeta variegata TaxID=151549 RepID=A0A4C1WSH2_EUMVA|nr:Calcitonin receptor [Eumeta japonica]
MSVNSGWCRALAVAERIAANAVFVCMLIEGIYLHRLIVAVFKKHHRMRILYGIGAVITIAPVFAWGIVMGLYNDHSCWVVYTIEHIQWILDAPRICILLINTVLFLDILRVLVTKVKNAENVNQLNTTKVTLFLMPVFGIQFLFTAFRPSTDCCTWEEVYFYSAYSLESLQGVIVALLYCYINKEVRNLVKGTYKKTEAVVSRVRKDSNYRRSTLGQDSDRRITFSTALDQSDAARKETTPKLQVAEMISVHSNERLAAILEPKYETVTTMGISNGGYEPIEKTNENFHGEDVSKQSHNDYLGTNADVSSVDSFSSDSVSEGSFTLNEPIQNEHFYGDKLNVNDSNPIETTGPEVNSKTENGKVDEKDICNLNSEDVENLDSELLNEIIEYVQSNRDSVVLDPEMLAPNRKREDRIIFVDE